MSDEKRTRREMDQLGTREIPENRRTGIHTWRARENFPLSGRPVHPALLAAFGDVKLACARTNRDLGLWRDDPPKADAIERACAELAAGQWCDELDLDAFQGGAGTSTNMAVNELLANRALELLGEPYGRYERVSPTDDINRHQSTNDTYPTALKLAAIRLLKGLEQRVTELQESFQVAEQRFAHVVKVGRTEMMDAVLTTLGREMGAYAEALSRDRWRIYKCEERLRVVNLGGTAIGTGLAAPRTYIFRVVDRLREQTGVGLARAENLVEATQNMDVFAEVSGIVKALAVNLLKISDDLRLMASGPEAGFGEIRLPPRQAGSSIMPGKINPVIPEAVTQAALSWFGRDLVIGLACAKGSLELNPFLPLVAHELLEGLTLIANACDILRRHCVEGIEADEARCRRQVLNSTATLTALVERIGYEQAARVGTLSAERGEDIRRTVVREELMTETEFDNLISPEAVCRLGSPPGRG